MSQMSQGLNSSYAGEGITSTLYNRDKYIGNVSIYPESEDAKLINTLQNEIRISYFSKEGERSVVLHSLTSGKVCFKMKPTERTERCRKRLFSLYSCCLQQSKTAVVLAGGNELHLVPMSSRDGQNEACFWAFHVDSHALYGSFLPMLNRNCLAIVLDLNETLVVANTLHTFDTHIERLRQEMAPGLSAEKYKQDRAILNDYIESDQVSDNGKLTKAQMETGPPSDNLEPVMRPVIRLRDRDIILTRINPKSPEYSSMLVRVRPGWEDFRNYLINKGRKRFEVYICTTSERRYALEMWRLLDPEETLFSHSELVDRLVCVKPGCRKSLLKVFHSGNCHPKLAMVIDDRLEVWDDRDQSRVHVVPAFSPYTAHLELEKRQPALCTARDIACNVRFRFFKYFNESFSPRMAKIVYETDVANLPSAPDASKYLADASKYLGVQGVHLKEATENDNNGLADGMIYAKAERKLKQDENMSSIVNVVMDNPDPKSFMLPLHQEQIIASPPSDIQVQPQQKQLNQCPFGMVEGEEKRCPQPRSEPHTLDTIHSKNNSFYPHPEYRHGMDRHNSYSRRMLPKEDFSDNNKRRPEFMLGEYSSFSGNHTSKSGFIPSLGAHTNNRNTKVVCGRGEDLFLGETESSIKLVGRPCRYNKQVASASEHKTNVEQILNENKKGLYNPVVALKELCAKEGLSFCLRILPNGDDREWHVEIEVAGNILGNTISTTLEDAQVQVAEKALNIIKPKIKQWAQNQLNSSRVSSSQPKKRIKLT